MFKFKTKIFFSVRNLKKKFYEYILKKKIKQRRHKK